jgi:two-component system sensor histidine kinase ResE
VIEGRKENDSRTIEMIADIPEDLPHIQADYDRITQVITNLVSNAYQYTPDEGSVTIKVTPDDVGVLIDVVDTGIGISEEDQARIFERFFRGEDPMVMRAAGTGLGLSIVQHLVEMHRGKVSFASKLNEGTTFSVWLPYVVKESEDDRHEQPAQET